MHPFLYTMFLIYIVTPFRSLLPVLPAKKNKRPRHMNTPKNHFWKPHDVFKIPGNLRIRKFRAILFLWESERESVSGGTRQLDATPRVYYIILHERAGERKKKVKGERERREAKSARGGSSSSRCSFARVARKKRRRALTLFLRIELLYPDRWSPLLPLPLRACFVLVIVVPVIAVNIRADFGNHLDASLLLSLIVPQVAGFVHVMCVCVCVGIAGY